MTTHSAPPEFSPEDEAAEILLELREELALLRDSIGHLRTDMHLITGRPRKLPPRRSVLRITSLPKDPTAPDFFHRINAVSAEDLEALRQQLTHSRSESNPDTSA